MADEGLTRALRARSPERLHEALHALLADEAAEWWRDSRDLMMAMAPYHDLARRLGLDPVAVFDAAAAGVPPGVAEVARMFGRRTDISETTFGYRIVEETAGPRYAHRYETLGAAPPPGGPPGPADR